MNTKSREYLYGTSVRMSAERAREARIEADKLSCIAWPTVCSASKGRHSPPRCSALNAGFRYLEVRCAGCDFHSTVDLTIVRRSKATTPIHELERWMACKGCSRVRGYRVKRGQLVALRRASISAKDPPSGWWPGER